MIGKDTCSQAEKQMANMFKCNIVIKYCYAHWSNSLKFTALILSKYNPKA